MYIININSLVCLRLQRTNRQTNVVRVYQTFLPHLNRTQLLKHSRKTVILTSKFEISHKQVMTVHLRQNLVNLSISSIQELNAFTHCVESKCSWLRHVGEWLLTEVRNIHYASLSFPHIIVRTLSLNSVFQITLRLLFFLLWKNKLYFNTKRWSVALGFIKIHKLSGWR